MEMDHCDKFDRAIERFYIAPYRGVFDAVTERDREATGDALIYLIDTLKIVKAGADAVFNEKAKPSDVIALMDFHIRLMEKMPKKESSERRNSEPKKHDEDSIPLFKDKSDNDIK